MGVNGTEPLPEPELQLLGAVRGVTGVFGSEGTGVSIKLDVGVGDVVNVLVLVRLEIGKQAVDAVAVVGAAAVGFTMNLWRPPGPRTPPTVPCTLCCTLANGAGANMNAANSGSLVAT